jgi:adenosylhomocysteine nucleosidase
VVNFGTAGSRRFKPGALVACDRFIQRDMDVTALKFPRGATPFEPKIPVMLEFERVFNELPHSVCGTADRFETQHFDDECDVVDMEAYALAKVCHLEGAQFASAKFISDGADSSAGIDWKENVSRAAAEFLRLYKQLL